MIPNFLKRINQSQLLDKYRKERAAHKRLIKRNRTKNPKVPLASLKDSFPMFFPYKDKSEKSS